MNNSYRAGRPARGRSMPQRNRFGGGQRSGGNRNRKPLGVSIDPQRFVNKAAPVHEAPAFTPTMAFSDFNFLPEVHRSVEAAGFKAPSAIQEGAIPVILEGKDVIGLANTGTGKTAAFLLPIINALLTYPDAAALIVAPTRELALQIEDQFRIFSRGLNLYSALCVGGMNIQRQIERVRRGPHVVIGTPGRLKDLMNRKLLSAKGASIFVLDEADQMLDMGFVNDIKFIMNDLPEQKQSLCFSATITPEISNLLNGLLVDPVTVSVRTRETSDHVEQDVIRFSSKEHKMEVLHELLAKPEMEKVLIFGETKWGVQRLADGLSEMGITSEAIHGNKSQPQRQRALNSFKRNDVRVLVATDVAARGLDIPNVSHVINFDIPQNYEQYVHRIGRTGRGGKRGNALTFVGGNQR